MLMSITKLNPYLNFNGTADKAIQLYERALGAKTEALQRYSEVPGMTVPEEHKRRVVHARLRIGEGGIVMISDTQPDTPAALEGNVHVCLDFDDVADATARFDALAQGGKITMPFQDTFWGAKFGMLTDAYGVRWMFNCNKGG
jgi:PhnB protein